MDFCNFVYILSIGDNFTWQSHCCNNLFVSRKKDRYVVNYSWREAFSNSYIVVLCHLHFDHNALLRCGESLLNDDKYFCFEAAEITHLAY